MRFIALAAVRQHRNPVRMNNGPVSLDTVLASFDRLWSPRIAARVNDYDVRVAKVQGDYVWHVHEDTDEFFLVLDGELRIALREPGGERVLRLGRGDVFTVPKGVEHKPSSPSGAAIMNFERAGTITVGDRHDEIPAHITATAGQPFTPDS
jgi:mannose-6-phosphate isomerase-like protein (cupin superfamily)